MKNREIHRGNLIIRTQADAEKYRNIIEVTGYLSINASSNLDALTSVGGDLSINASSNLDALTSVGGDLYIHSPANLDALTSVGGYLYIHSPANLDALTSVGGSMYINAKGSLTANKLYAGGYSKFGVIDGIGCFVFSEKQKDGITISMCRHSKIKNQKVVGEKFYVASHGENNAHGKTISEAVQELAFKIGARDVSQWKNLPATTRKTPQEWAFVYRMVTGACRYGTERFLANKGKLKKTYTLAEIIAETKGAYGHSSFCDVVGAS